MRITKRIVRRDTEQLEYVKFIAGKLANINIGFTGGDYILTTDRLGASDEASDTVSASLTVSGSLTWTFYNWLRHRMKLIGDARIRVKYGATLVAGTATLDTVKAELLYRDKNGNETSIASQTITKNLSLTTTEAIKWELFCLNDIEKVIEDVERLALKLTFTLTLGATSEATIKVYINRNDDVTYVTVPVVA